MSYREIKSRANILVDSGNVKKKGRLNYFTSRDGNILDCMPYDLYNLNEYHNFDISQEVFSLMDICFISDGMPEFNVFRGFNFSTKLIYDKKNKIFKEKRYDKIYYQNIMISQNIARVNRKKLEFDFKDFIRLIVGSAIFFVFGLFFVVGLLLFPTS